MMTKMRAERKKKLKWEKEKEVVVHNAIGSAGIIMVTTFRSTRSAEER